MLQTVDAQVQTSCALLQDLLQGYGPHNFAVRFWDGTTWGPQAGQPAAFTLHLKHPGSLRKMLWPPSILTLTQAYVYGDFDIEGDMLGFIRLCYFFTELNATLSLKRRLSLGWR